MDKATRNAIERATQRARKLLEQDFLLQLEGTYDVLPSGVVAAKGGPHLEPPQHLVREKIVAAVEHKRAAGANPGEAVAAYARDAAFTTLNRFVALKMLEARGLVQECITKGELSSGYRELCGLAPDVALLPDGAGYRLYVESLFDELATEVKVLFDRRDPASVLWPKRQTFEELLVVLNGPELAGVWIEDETIGWVYQFFNSGVDRERARYDEAGRPKPPQNSQELAVRNQFFTPRYVVRFLAENTLARTWIEMMGEATRIADQCDFLVTDVESRGARQKKDPRDIKLLDPAAGSGHFLLYAFDLFLTIYEEAWNDPGAAPLAATGRTLRRDYPDAASLCRAIPSLILACNLHGVDIDPRCAQIAALALWLRAQRAYRDFGIPTSERPRITRTHIVVAEPMPGDATLVEAFAKSLQPPLLGDLFRKMVAEMRLAGELGSLIRVEKGVGDELHCAREEWNRQREPGDYLPGMAEFRVQGLLNLSQIDDAGFFEEAETLLLAALRSFAESTAGAAGVRRRLFADDAGQGIALIDLLRTKFDVVLMNPPFGDPVGELPSDYRVVPKDLYSCFVERACSLLGPSGLVGALTSASFRTYVDYERHRTRFFSSGRVPLFLDLGWEVLEGAYVDTAAYLVLPIGESVGVAHFVDVRDRVDREQAAAAKALASDCGYCYTRDPRRFSMLPGTPLLYSWADSTLSRVARFASLGTLCEAIGKGAGPHAHFYRLRWEVPPAGIGLGKIWGSFVNGGSYSPFRREDSVLLRWDGNGAQVKSFLLQRYPYRDGSTEWNIQMEDHYGRPGLTYGKKTSSFSAQIMPAGSIFSFEGMGVFPSKPEDVWWVLGYLNSGFARVYLNATCGLHKNPPYVRKLPVPDFSSAQRTVLAQAAHEGWQIQFASARNDERASVFVLPESIGPATARRNDIGEVLRSIDEVTVHASHLKTEEFAAIAPDRPGDEAAERSAEREVYRGTRDMRESTVVSWAAAVAFGRFDVRLATGERSAPPEPDPFDPLPVCSPGMLTGDDGLPLAGPPPSYPLAFPPDGVLVDEPGHPRDLAAAVRAVFDVVFGADADARWREASELLDPKGHDLRAWLSGSFFEHHLKRYSKSRRKAPILWQLATPSGSYSLWLYAHRLTSDTFFHLQNEYVGPKLAHEERKLTALVQDGGPNPTATARKAIDKQETFVEELRALREEVARVAPLWKPDLNDGVLLTAAPLWRLVPQHRAWQKELRSAWESLASGKYDWGHLAMHLWPERVVPKCATDRSLAIAHGLEDVFWVEGSDGKWKARSKPTRPVTELVAERSSVAVKAALKSLLEASPSGAKGPRRSTRSRGAR